jgi:hypothetical protein
MSTPRVVDTSSNDIYPVIDQDTDYRLPTRTALIWICAIYTGVDDIMGGAHFSYLRRHKCPHLVYLSPTG